MSATARLLMASLFLVTGVLGGAVPSGCQEVDRMQSDCPTVGGGIRGDAVVLDGEWTIPGSSGSRTSDPGAGSGVVAGDPEPGDGRGAERGSQLTRLCLEILPGYCYARGRPKPGAGLAQPGANAVQPGTVPITLRSIAAFQPSDPGQSMQPGGWTIPGMPINLIAHAETHTVAGTLLGAPAHVRFDPVGFRWRYGDGNAARLATPGARWEALGLNEFDPTPTSHVFRAPGTYVVALDVEFAASYRFAGGVWRPIEGVIVRAANDLTVRVGSAVTVLVDRDCTELSTGPGC